jgi:uncharacterized protein
MTEPSRGRIAFLDALRGFALLAILQVNIQSFCWGPGEPLGYPHGDGGRFEVLLLFLQSAFLEGKIRPMLGFLFGLGLALQLRAHGGSWSARAPRWAWRRMGFLFVAGIAHSLLLYYGDALVTYAACGSLLLVLALPARGRTGAVVAVAWIGAVASVALACVLTPVEAEPGAMFATLPAHATYALDGFAAQLRQRIEDAGWQQLGGVPFGWPEQLAWIASGWMAARLGWMRYPHLRPVAARLWGRARAIAWLFGLPCALAAAAMHAARFERALDPDPLEVALSSAGGLLAFAYLDLGARLLARADARPAPTRPTSILATGLAALGRMPLTNYFAQSLAMAALLSGWGLGLEAHASRFGLAAIAAAIGVAQLVASSLWMRRWRNGPLEWAWRKWSY